MATSSLALQRAGLIDPTKPATYPVILGEDILSNGEPGNRGKAFTGIRYNFKPRHLTDNNTQRKSTLTSGGGSDGDFEVTFRDNSGGRYIYAGTRVSKNSKYVLIFDSKMRRFILHRLDSVFIMNMVDTPTNHDTAGLKKKHSHINETTKRPRPPRGANQLVRRPPPKKSSGGSTGPMRPMSKPLVRASPKPVAVLRSSHDIKKKDRRVPLNVPSDGSGPDPDRETKAARDVREQREAIVMTSARDARDNRKADSSFSRDASTTATPRGAREAALYQKSKALALSSRPREASKLSMETKASSDSREYREAADGKDASAKDSKFLKVPDSKARLPEKPRPIEKPDKAGKTDKSLASDRYQLPAKPVVRAGKDAGKNRKDAEDFSPTKEGKRTTAKPLSKSSSSDSPNDKTTKAKNVPLPLPMPSPATAPALADKKKKKKGIWEEEDDEEDDDGDIGLVIEYPGGPPSSRNRQATGSGAGDGGSGDSQRQLHMPTFDEFQLAGDADYMEDDAEDDGDMEGYWDPREDEKEAKVEKGASSASTVAPTPASSASKVAAKSAPKPAAKSTGTPKPGSAKHGVYKSAAVALDEDSDEDAMVDDLEAELENELEAELNKELQEEEARKKREADALLDAELEAAFMAQEEESEISEEE